MENNDDETLEELRTKKEEDIKSFLSKKKINHFELDEFMTEDD